VFEKGEDGVELDGLGLDGLGFTTRNFSALGRPKGARSWAVRARGAAGVRACGQMGGRTGVWVCGRACRGRLSGARVKAVKQPVAAGPGRSTG